MPVCPGHPDPTGQVPDDARGRALSAVEEQALIDREVALTQVHAMRAELDAARERVAAVERAAAGERRARWEELERAAADRAAAAHDRHVAAVDRAQAEIDAQLVVLPYDATTHGS